jgi:pSer/pThr/pTyr-binding forkhead associated (FHA) protein
MKTYVIGRSKDADISIADDSVARRHAEIVVTDGGRYHLTDCASAAGTWRADVAEQDGAGWRPVRQDFVGGDEPIRLGDYRCTVRALLREATDGGDDSGAVSGEAAPGPVERDPVTGEIVRRRL